MVLGFFYLSQQSVISAASIVQIQSTNIIKKKAHKPIFKIILVKCSCLYLIYFKNYDELSNSRSEFKFWAEKSTAGETRQQNLNRHAEGLIKAIFWNNSIQSLLLVILCDLVSREEWYATSTD
jgi:hypothetical protein